MRRGQTVRCKYCGRLLHNAWIPNRGNVTAHAKGDGEACSRLIATGRDMITRAAEDAALKAEQERRRAEYLTGRAATLRACLDIPGDAEGGRIVTASEWLSDQSLAPKTIIDALVALRQRKPYRAPNGAWSLTPLEA